MQKKLKLEKRRTAVCIMFFMGHAHSQIRNFGSYLRIVVGLVEDDIQLI